MDNKIAPRPTAGECIYKDIEPVWVYKGIEKDLRNLFFAVYYSEKLTIKQAVDLVQRDPILSKDKEIYIFLAELMEEKYRD